MNTTDIRKRWTHLTSINPVGCSAPDDRCDDCGCYCGEFPIANDALSTMGRQDIPLLLDTVDALRERVRILEANTSKSVLKRLDALAQARGTE